MSISVSNLLFNFNQEDLTKVFAEYGTVKLVKLLTDRETGQPLGSALVEMSTEEEEEASIAALNGAERMGRTLRVNKVAKPQYPGGPGRPGGSGGGGQGGRGRYP